MHVYFDILTSADAELQSRAIQLAVHESKFSLNSNVSFVNSVINKTNSQAREKSFKNKVSSIISPICALLYESIA